MDKVIDRIIIEPFERVYEKVLIFLPNFLISLVILTLGIVIGVILKRVSMRLLRAISLDKISERIGMSEILLKGGIKESVSSLLSRIIGWLTALTFLIMSLSALNIPSVENLLEKFFLYLPNVFVAAIILFFGYLLSNFLGRTALIASVNAGIKISGLIGKFVKLTVFFLAITMALEQLGIGRETIIVTFAVIFGGIVLSFAIAFGLGGRNVAKTYIEKKLEGEEEKDEIQHL